MKKKTKSDCNFNCSLLITLFLFFNQLVNMITDYQWFNDLGYASVFTQKMTSQLKIAVPVFILFFFNKLLLFKVIKEKLL